MTQWLKQSTTATIKFGPFLDDVDGKTAKTNLTISQADIRVSKNDGEFAQTNNALGASHDEAGYYNAILDATDLNTPGRLKVAVNKSGALPVWHNFMVLSDDMYDSLIGTGVTFSNVFSTLGTIAPTTDSSDSAILTFGTTISGTFIDTQTDDDTRYILAPSNPSGLDMTLVFNIGLGRAPVAVSVNGYWNGPGQHANILAYDYIYNIWDQLTNSSTRLASRNSDANYTLPLNREHIDPETGNVSIRFVSISTNTGHRLYLDAVLVSTVNSSQGQSAGITAQDIWTFRDRSLTSSETGEPANPEEIALAVREELTTELGRIDDTISSRATQSSVTTIDGNVDAVKAKTDNLPIDPAATSDIPDTSLLALEATSQLIRSDIALLSTGRGARTVIITINDGTLPLQNARIRLTEGVSTFIGDTDESGEVTFNLDDATYVVAITKAGYEYTGSTLEIIEDISIIYSMALGTFSPIVSAPGQSTGWIYCYNYNGELESNVVIQVQQTATPEVDSYAFDSAVYAETSNADGFVEFPGLWIGATYKARRNSGTWHSFIVPDATDFALPAMLGR
jgi:hypothetical protein